MTQQSHGPSFSPDRPIHNIEDDLLGRGDFAISMANALSGWRGDESLVLALYGKWGSGKSSVKNLILHFLSKAERPLTVVEFNPWAWSGQDRLLSAFFTEIGHAIGHKGKGEERKAAAVKWKKYSTRLAWGGKALKFGKIVGQTAGVPVLPTVLQVLGDKAEEGSELLKQVGEAFSDEDEESLEELKASLSESMLKLPEPVLVVLDDVDRLTSEETKLLFQLVKINADFPNLVFLLLFERAVVEKALLDASGSDGREYMEKIVQVGFDLPEVSRGALDATFFQGLDHLLDGHAGWDRVFDKDRWSRGFVRGLQPFLQTMRDVRRLLSAFSFTVGLFCRDGTFEVNLIDLLGVEVLRIFEPDVYRLLPANREVLLGDTSYSHARDSEKRRNERTQKIESLLGASTTGRRESLQHLLEELFPTITRNLSGFEEEWVRGLRVCSSETFARYFVMTVPEGDVPVSLIDSVIAACSSLPDIRQLLQKLLEADKLVPLLERFEAYKSILDLSLAQSFITALFDVGDQIPDRTTSVFDPGPRMTANRIVYHWLKRDEDVKRRGATILGALQSSTGLYLPVDFIALESDRKGKEEYASDMLLDDEDLAAAQTICITKMLAASESGQLLGPRLGYYLWRWKKWTDGKPPKEFVSKFLSSVRNALLLLRGFVTERRSTNLETGISKSRPALRLNDLEPFVDIDQLATMLAPVLTPEGESQRLAEEFAKELRAFRRMLDRKAKGQSNESAFFDDDD